MEKIVVSAKDIGVVLQTMRRQRGMSQTELGKRVGLDQQKVSLIENGNPNTRLDSLFRLLSALDAGLVVQPKNDQTVLDPDRW